LVLTIGPPCHGSPPQHQLARCAAGSRTALILGNSATAGKIVSAQVDSRLIAAATETLRNIPKSVVWRRQRRRMPLHDALGLHPHAAIRAAHIDRPHNEAGIGGGKAARRSISRHHRRGGVERRSPGKNGRGRERCEEDLAHARPHEIGGSAAGESRWSHISEKLIFVFLRDRRVQDTGGHKAKISLASRMPRKL
jgi:hypothetical protein